MSISLHENKKPNVVRNIAVYTLGTDGGLKNVNRLADRIEQHIHILRGLGTKGLLISLEGTQGITKESIEAIVKSLIAIHVRLRVATGMCDYSAKLFNVLKPFVLKTPLALFRTHEIMALAIGTSGVYSHATLLAYADDLDDRQSIASTLISNSYFVVVASSIDDVKSKMKDKDRYEAVVTHSYFGFMNESASVVFDRGAFVYEFRGDLNSDIANSLKVDDFKHRLSIAHKVFIFDLTRIYHMDMKAALLFIELERLAAEAGAQICLVDINRTKIDNNAYEILVKSEFWIFDTLDEVFEDEDIIEFTDKRKNMVISGLSKDTIGIAPQLLAAGVQTLEIYEFKNVKKRPSKQIELQDLAALKPTICTGIAFDGDVDGELIFIFKQGISELLIENILGGFDDDAQGEDFLDAMSEFVNSVSGKLKANLHKKERCIHFSLPHSTAALTDLVPLTSYDKPAVLMTFSCQDKEFYVALTSPIQK